MHINIYMYHHPDPERDARCFVYAVEDLTKATTERRLRKLRTTSKTARLHKDEKLYLQWLKEGVQPARAHREWLIFASREFLKTHLYIAQKSAWLAGWDPINMKDPLYHWSLSMPDSALQLIERGQPACESCRPGFSLAAASQRITGAAIATLKGFITLDPQCGIALEQVVAALALNDIVLNTLEVETTDPENGVTETLDLVKRVLQFCRKVLEMVQGGDSSGA